MEEIEKSQAPFNGECKEGNQTPFNVKVNGSSQVLLNVEKKEGSQSPFNGK